MTQTAATITMTAAEIATVGEDVFQNNSFISVDDDRVRISGISAKCFHYNVYVRGRRVDNGVNYDMTQAFLVVPNA